MVTILESFIETVTIVCVEKLRKDGIREKQFENIVMFDFKLLQ